MPSTHNQSTHRSTIAKFQLKFVCIRHTHVLSKSYIVSVSVYRRRRRLEPLFEEETESDEEKTQQDNDDVKKVGRYYSKSQTHAPNQKKEPRFQIELQPCSVLAFRSNSAFRCMANYSVQGQLYPSTSNKREREKER